MEGTSVQGVSVRQSHFPKENWTYAALAVADATFNDLGQIEEFGPSVPLCQGNQWIIRPCHAAAGIFPNRQIGITL